MPMSRARELYCCSHPDPVLSRHFSVPMFVLLPFHVEDFSQTGFIVEDVVA